MTQSDPNEASMFAQLSDAAGHALADEEGAAQWTMLRGSTGFGQFAQTVGSLRVGEVDAVQTPRFSEPADVFLAAWLAQRHGKSSRADNFVVAIEDPTRIWATRLLGFLESTTNASRTRLNFVHAQASGGSLSLNYLPMNDVEGVQLHLYSAEARERTEHVSKTVDAVHSACDFLVQLVGPMEPQSFEHVAQRVRGLMQRPDRRLKLVLFIVSPTATRLRPALEALGQELGDSVAAVQGNLVQMDQVWNTTLGQLARYVNQNAAAFPLLPSAGSEAADTIPGDLLVSDGARSAAAAASEQDMVRSFAASAGVRWAALLEADGELRVLEAQQPPLAEAAVNAMLLWLQADHGQTPAQEFFVETSHTITLAQPLSSSQQWFAVQFDKAEINPPLARLLMSRMVEELDPQDALQ